MALYTDIVLSSIESEKGSIILEVVDNEPVTRGKSDETRTRIWKSGHCVIAGGGGLLCHEHN